jgi:cobalamin biosynthesis Mg chelatase CobN
LQVDEIKNLLKSILKGKSKEIDPEDMLIEPLPKVSKKKKKPAKVTKISKKKKPAHRSRSASSSSRSEGESSERSGRSSSSSSSHSSSRSPSPSPSRSPARQEYIHFEDMDKDFKNALRVSILFVYLPNCILTDLYFAISRKFWG